MSNEKLNTSDNLEKQSPIDLNESISNLDKKILKNIGSKCNSIEDVINTGTGLELSLLSKELQKTILKNSEFKNTESKNYKVETLDFLNNNLDLVRKRIEGLSKNERLFLKSEINENLEYSIIETKNPFEKLLPNNFVKACKNPKNISEHFAGACLGTVNSTINTGIFIAKVGVGIIKLPLVLYLVLSGKGKIEGWKNV